ncbi:hypothetical protein [Actinomycetospora sp. CA-053990]|uniref:hypothetical protein n=1 Tax=Actinomycetospora sp. CA-053990 TaxID=3239891 RepID=UPI003D941ACA
MSLRTRLALAFAVVAAVVAGLVGVLSYHSAGERTADETDRSLGAATTALLEGQTAVLGALPPVTPTDQDGLDGDEPGRPDPRREGPSLVAQQVAADGTVTFLGGPPGPAARRRRHAPARRPGRRRADRDDRDRPRPGRLPRPYDRAG